MDGRIQTGDGRAGRAGSISSRSASSGSRRSGCYLWWEVGEASGVYWEYRTGTGGGYHGVVEYIVSLTAYISARPLHFFHIY